MEKGQFSMEKMQEPEDNMRYAERKAVRMMNNGLNETPSKMQKREKKDFEILKTKEGNRDTFGPLTQKESDRLEKLKIKRMDKDKDANYWFNFTFCCKLCWWIDIKQRCLFNATWRSIIITKFWTWY